jgi:hypothetical protein
MLVYCLAYSLTLKIVVMWYSEISVDIQRTTRRYVQEDASICNYRCENLKSCKKKVKHFFSLDVGSDDGEEEEESINCVKYNFTGVLILSRFGSFPGHSLVGLDHLA